MKNRKKGSIMPMVVIGLMMVSVIALIFLSAAVSGNTAYQTSADALDERLELDNIGQKFKKSENYSDAVKKLSNINNVSLVEEDGHTPTKYNVILSYDNKMLIVKAEDMKDVLLTVIVETEDETHERRVKVWTYGAYAAK